MKIIKEFFRDIYIDLLVFSVFLIYILRYFKISSIYDILGLTLSIFFVILWILARINLGSSFSVKPETKKLVTNGLYSKIRHPIYLFSFLAYISLLLIQHSSFLYLVGVIILIIQAYRIRLENKKLKDSFDGQYENYRRKTFF